MAVAKTNAQKSQSADTVKPVATTETKTTEVVATPEKTEEKKTAEVNVEPEKKQQRRKQQQEKKLQQKKALREDQNRRQKEPWNFMFSSAEKKFLIRI